VPDEDADDDFLPTDNSEEDFGDEVADEDADNFLLTDNSVCIFASEGEHVLPLSSLLAPNYRPQLERLSKFHLRFCLLVLPLTMLIFHVIFF
jgi:hypothetical protein